MTHSAVMLALDALACFRLTRLICADTLTAPLREALIGARPAHSRDLGGQRIMVAARPGLAAFITCPWCVSPYVAVAVVAAQSLCPSLWLYPAAVLAFSAVAGVLAERA